MMFYSKELRSSMVRSLVLSTIAIGSSLALLSSPTLAQSQSKPKPKPTSPWAVQKTSTWKTFVAQQGRFSILMPDKPKLSSAPLSFEKLGKSTIWAIEGTDLAAPRTMYGVAYLDFPNLDVGHDPELLQLALEGGTDSYLRNQSVTLIGRSKFSLNGFPGQEIKFRHRSNAKYTGRLRAFLVDKRLYMIMVTTDQEAKHKQKIDRFLQSFKLL